jgi:mono/diheme cytochrome c family protein
MVFKKVTFVVLLLVAGLLSACSTPATATQSPATQVAAVSASDTPAAMATEAIAATTPAAAAAGVSFTDNILPIFQNSCINCHGGERIEKGLSLRTYADMMSGSQNGAVVIPGNAQESSLATSVASHKMPKRGPKLSDAQVQLIIDWINQGAQDN